MEPLGEQGLYGAFERIARVSSRPGYRGCPFVRAALELPSDHPALKPIASYKRSLRGRVERHLRAAQVPNRREMVMQVILLIDAAATECATERRSYPAHIGRRLVESSIAANRR